MITDLNLIRNIGISAHIDSGKTTLTERILFYTGRIHAIHEVKGKDGVGATMDSMDLERERGITIQSAATHCSWKDTEDPNGKLHHVNIIDTPGHVDFTIEVERALRVLDGAVLVLCAVAGVQSQSLTVDRQMRRYNVPRLAFVNKCDRQGANPYRVTEQLREKLGHNAVMVTLPIGLEEKHNGIIDLVKMKAYYFDGDNGENLRAEPIPAEMAAHVQEYRDLLLDKVSMYSDQLMEEILEERVQEDTVNEAIRAGVNSLKLVPVFCGSAYKNRGVQVLLNGVVKYLPAPPDVKNEAVDLGKNEEKLVIPSDPTGPLLMLAFKLEDGRYGQLTYLRVYQGTVRKGDTIVNARNGQKLKVGRLVRMHSNEMEDIEDSSAGDIIAIFGVDCYSGDTFHDGSLNVAMSSMHVPAAVIDLTIKPKTNAGQANMSKALRRFSKEDPTFRVSSDPETGDTIISGMGELHLDVYVERMKREYACEVLTSPPRVAYRETISQRADFNYTHKKQTGGSGQYGRVAGWMEPMEGTYEFVDDIVGGSIPREFIPSCDKGFRKCLEKGELIGANIVGIKVGINDGQFHAVDSSDIAFQLAAIGGFREAYAKAKPVVLEPIMKVGLEGPAEFHGAMVGTLMQRRGIIIGSQEVDGFSQIEAEVPLAEMFGYSTTLRSATQGKAEFTMEFARYSVAPNNITDELVKKYQQEKKDK
ncbi:MAG: elongation factor G [Deltaproteobacteria bacterium]|nr:elongation factor G [Deltaproteobacteria bacterium]